MKIIPLFVSVIVSIIVVLMVLTPAINDYGSDHDTLDIVVLTGQSNMAYRESLNYRVNPDIVSAEFPTTSGIYYYGTDTSPATYEVIGSPDYDPTFERYSIMPMCNTSQYIIGGFEAPLAYTMHNRSGHDVLVLNVAVAGAPIDWLNPAGTWGTFAEGVIDHALNDVSARYSKINKIGWVCIQGEANKTTPIDTYESYFMRMADWLDSKGFHEGYIIPPRASDGGNSIVAQLDLAEKYDHLHIACYGVSDSFSTLNNQLYSDNLHYTENGRIILAKEMGVILSEELTPPYHNLFEIIPIILIIAIISIVGFAIIRDKP